MATRNESLEAWLERVDARQAWKVKTPAGELSAYVVNGFSVLVHRYKGGHGWEIYVPSSNSNDVTITLDKAAEFCGVDVSRVPI